MNLSHELKEFPPQSTHNIQPKDWDLENEMKASFTQESLWLIERMCRDSGPAYNEPLVFQINGHLQVDLLCQSMHSVVERHESLRTVFRETADGIRAKVYDSIPEFIEVIDLKDLNLEDAKKEADALIVDRYSHPFNLAKGPLIRGIIVKLSEEESILGITIHHIVTDGWSMGIILEEIGQNYASLCQFGKLADFKPTVQYKHYVERLHQYFEQGKFDQKIKDWKNTLQDAPNLLNLPTDRIRPAVQSFKGSTFTIKVPKIKFLPLIDGCFRECNATEFVTFLSAYAVLLKRYSNQNDLNIGTTILNRNHYDYLGTVGCFVNTATFFFQTNEKMTFKELVTLATEQSIEMLQKQDVPYSKLIESLGIERDPSFNPLFQTMMTWLGKKITLTLDDEIFCIPKRIKRIGAKFDLLMYISDLGNDFEFEVEFNTDLFDLSTIERMMNNYIHLLDQLAKNIDVRVSQVSILPEEEKSLIVDVWNDTNIDYPQTTVIDMFESQVLKTPNAIAVEFNESSLTYHELNVLTNRVAKYLINKRVNQGSTFVGVYMERSIDMVVALVSIMKAGLAYVPIDPEYPKDRIHYMIQDSAVPLILTQNKHRNALTSVESETIVLSDLELPPDDGTDVIRSLVPDSSVYMIYTSGSTGRPKGVVNRHESLFNRLYWMQDMYRLTNEDCVLQKTPFSFDVSVWEFFWPLMFGARIVMAEPGGHRDPDYLKQIIQEKRINVIHFVPSMLNVFLEEEELESYCSSLRLVFCSGEALPYTTVEKFYNLLSCELHNLYGPTEAAIDVSYWACTKDYPGNIVPIGKPVANTRLYVLDKHMQILPISAPGELHIGGIQLAKGYHNREELNEKSFVPDPFSIESSARLYKTGDLARYLPDGQIQYLGRIDNQVKLRGFRIELGEIEAIVRRLPAVKDAAVVLHEDNDRKILCAYVVTDDNFDSQVAKDKVGQQLPEFMVPQIFVQVPHLQTTTNGKLDRKNLPDPFANLDFKVESEVQPTTKEERVLLQIWREILKVEQIGVDSNFFQLGGDSILSIRVVAQLRESGYKIEVHEIFINPTIRLLAKKLTRVTQEEAYSTIANPFSLIDVADRHELGPEIEDAWPISLLQSGMIYHSMLDEESPIYHDIFLFNLRAPIHEEYLKIAFQKVVENRPQLRAMFDLENFSQPLQLIYRELEIPVDIVDISHLSLSDKNQYVNSWIEHEKVHPFDFSKAPLLRVKIHIFSENEFNLGISFHHAILDGWSVSLVVNDFTKGYSDLLNKSDIILKPEQLKYSSYIYLEQQAIRDQEHIDFWASHVSDISRTSLFSEERNTFEYGTELLASNEYIIPQHLERDLQTIASKQNLPTKSLLLAVHFLTLGRMFGTSEVVTGLVVNGRPEIQGGEEIAGLFLNTIPLKMKLSEEPWSAMFMKVFELEQKVMKYRRFPFAEILKSGSKALFDVAFNYTDFHLYRHQENKSVEILNAHYFEQTNIPIVVHLHRDNFSNQMRIMVNYDINQIESKLIGQYLNLFHEITAEVVANNKNSIVYAKLDGNESVHLEQDLVTIRKLKEKNNDFNPMTELERQLAEIFSSALGINNIELDDNFLNLGMDSIKAIRVVAKIKRLGIKVSIRDIFDKATIRKLAKFGDSKIGAVTSKDYMNSFELVPVHERVFPPTVVDAYPATSMQLYMINSSQIDVKQGIYQDVFSYDLALPLNETLLRNCLEKITNDYEVFRTAFSLTSYSIPMQLIYDFIQPQLEIIDYSFLSEVEKEKLFYDWFEREKSKGFDLSKPGLIRFYAHRYNLEEFKLTLSFHHSIIDGWSISLFIKQLVETYVVSFTANKVVKSQPPTLKYRDYVKVELESRTSDELRSFWLNKLKGYRYNSLIQPKLDNKSRWSETKLLLEPMMQESLINLSKRLGVPLKHTLLTGHLVVMSLLCGENDVLTGVFSNGRPEEEESEKVLGMFLNFIPFRQNINDQTWKNLIKETFDNDRQCIPYRRYPLGNILKDLKCDRLFETVFNYTHFKQYVDIALVNDKVGTNQLLKEVYWFEHTDFHLLVNMGHDLQNRIIMTLNANGRVLSQQYLETISHMYKIIFEQMIQNENGIITDIPDLIFELIEQLKNL